MKSWERYVRVFPATAYFVMSEKRPIGYEVTAVINHDLETTRLYPLTRRRAERVVSNLIAAAEFFEKAHGHTSAKAAPE
jgi:hypothetical protein